jgi:hypothetical protein
MSQNDITLVVEPLLYEQLEKGDLYAYESDPRTRRFRARDSKHRPKNIGRMVLRYYAEVPEETCTCPSKLEAEANMFAWLKRSLLGAVADSLKALHRRLGRMETLLMSMNEGQTNLTAAIEQLHGTITDLSGDVQYTVQQLQNRNTELQTALDGARTELGELRNLLQQEEIDDVTAQETINRLEGRLNEAQANAATPEALTSLQGLNSALQSLDNTLQQKPEETPTEPTETTPEPGESGGEVVPAAPPQP